MRLIDFPKQVALDQYHSAINTVCDHLMNVDGCVAVYQVGGLSAPGISDIDLVAVFRDDAHYENDPRDELSSCERYLFTHSVFGAPQSLFLESHEFTFFHNYRHLAGNTLPLHGEQHRTSADRLMMRQSANEYLLRMYVNMLVEKTFGVCKVRNLLLNVKALLYDVEFLDIDSPSLNEGLQQVIQWRAEWFKKRPSNQQLSSWYVIFWRQFHSFLSAHFENETIYLPLPRHRIGRNIQLKQGSPLVGTHRGLRLPWVPALGSRRIMSLLHRLGRFSVCVPYKCGDETPHRIKRSFDYSRRSQSHNARHLPRFMSLTSSLVLQA